MYLTETFFYSAVYIVWFGGLILGVIVAFLVTTHEYSSEAKRNYDSKSSLIERNTKLIGDIKMSRLAGLRDARAVLKKSQNLNDADKKLADIERRVQTS